MPGVADPVKVERVLKELYAKKRWLDTMIASLEAAVESPHYRLIQRVNQALSNGDGAKPKVDIRKQQQARLAELATQVGKTRRIRRRGRISAERRLDQV